MSVSTSSRANPPASAEPHNVALGEVCVRQTGVRNPTESPAISFTYIDISAVDNTLKRITSPRTLKGKDAPSRARNIVRFGDVLVSTTRPNLNAVAIVPQEFDNQICSTGFCVLRAGPRLYPHYLFLFVQSPAFVSSLTELVKGALYPAVTDGQVFAQRIPLPAMSEQRRIADQLTDAIVGVESLRRAAQERLDAATALPPAILREEFERQRAVGSQRRSLSELLVRHNEVIHPGDRKSGKAEFVGLEHIEAHTGRRLGSQEIDFGQLSGRKPTFRKGQIVYGYLRPYLNKVWIAEFDGCSSVDQFAFDVRPDLADTRYVAAFMRSDTFLRRSAIVTTTGQLPRISIDEIASVPIELPANLAEQSRIADDLYERLSVADAMIARCREELDAVEAIPSALIRTAFAPGH